MKLKDINIRDPFILCENSRYYLYGTRAKDFGMRVSGFDVYVSDDLENFSEAKCCFDSEKAGLNNGVNWAPEVHKYGGKYYMFATFTKENGLRGTYILSSDSPEGEFTLHSHGAVTPYEWECLDGTLYVENGEAYLVFCHEHTQITDGTICYVKLSPDLKKAQGEVAIIFSGSSPYYVEEKPKGEHYITDGPFMHKNADGKLYMIWSTFINHRYSQCIARSVTGSITGKFEHLEPLIKDDGGHGMIFEHGKDLYLTFHSPNETGYERPKIVPVCETDSGLIIKG